MPFFARILLGILLSFFWIQNEFRNRKKLNKSPQNTRQLIRLGSMSNNKDRKTTALIFSSLCFYFFSLWEAVIRHMFYFELSFISFAAGVLFVLLSLYLRLNHLKKNNFKMYLEDYLLFFAGSALCFGALMSFIFFPWLVWRSYLRLDMSGKAKAS